MTRHLLDPMLFNIFLGVLAVATPLLGFLLYRTGKARRRVALAIGASGPFVALFWGFHNLVLHVVGFDRIWSVLIILGVAGITGFLVGRALRSEVGR